MNKQNDYVPSNLVLTGSISSAIASVVSITYIILSIFALVYRNDCGAIQDDWTQFLWNTVYTVYIQDKTCGNHVTGMNQEVLNGITQSYTVYVFVSIILSFSIVTLITSMVLMALIHNMKTMQYVNIYVYAYIVSWIATLIVDVTFATHLGLDFSYLTDLMVEDANYNFILDLLRQGTFYLMAIAMKGYVLHVINLVLIIMMIYFVHDYKDKLKKAQHPIHNLGTISAYDEQRNIDDTWLSLSRPSNTVHRSNSWYHQQVNSTPMTAQPVPLPLAPRGFSYLEEVQTPAQAQASKKPVAYDNWRGPWRAPPVPAPDYSPQRPRRLKSALKSQYI